MKVPQSVRGFPEYVGDHHLQIKTQVIMVNFHKDFKKLVWLYYISLWYKSGKRHLIKRFKDMFW